MKHGTLNIHSKEWVTFFQKINTDITQRAEAGVGGGWGESRQGADMGVCVFLVQQWRGRAKRFERLD